MKGQAIRALLDLKIKSKTGQFKIGCQHNYMWKGMGEFTHVCSICGKGQIRTYQYGNKRGYIMTMRDFIKTNKDELDECIHGVCKNLTLNDEDRRQWILNDEGLYKWARSEGVKI